jgi:diacylglycerol kinase family enzyme
VQTPVAVILNPSAGAHGHDDLKQRIEELFREAGLDAQVEVAPTGNAVPKLARTALERGCGIIVAEGGDGTVSSVADVLAGTDVMLGVLPLGTLNHFAKDLHIPLDLESATKNIVAGRMKKVDVGKKYRDSDVDRSKHAISWPAALAEPVERTSPHQSGRLPAPS